MTAFRDFVDSHKKDVILFQLEAMLQDAGNDSTKRASLVNQIAESISRLNKAEDFTRQQDYIQRCAELMKIDEAGLTALVNKFIRERIGKEEKKQLRETSTPALDPSPTPSDDLLELVSRDEQHERGTLRALLEFGLKPWDENATVAEHVFREMEVNALEDLFDNRELVHLLQAYRNLYLQGLEPTARSFLYHEDHGLNQIAVSLMDSPHELSPNWKAHFDGPMPTRDELYRQEVYSSLNYLKLRKIKRLINENQRDLEKGQVSDKDMMMLLQTHKHLKVLEMELTRQIGTVILR